MEEQEKVVRAIIANAIAGFLHEIDPTIQRFQQAMDLLKEFPGLYEDHQLEGHSLDDYYNRVQVFIDQKQGERF